MRRQVSCHDAGRTITIRQPDPDAGGSLTSPVTTYTYDAYARVTTITNPDSTTKTFTYDT